ncbi:MAG: hypothetical protein JO116_21970 [Planctomycetaceae bacterium]|nr:hypothetical protein [Planctomycetaceae bacterium]
MDTRYLEAGVKLLLTGAVVVGLCVETPYFDPGVMALPVVGLLLGGVACIGRGLKDPEG